MQPAFKSRSRPFWLTAARVLWFTLNWAWKTFLGRMWEIPVERYIFQSSLPVSPPVSPPIWWTSCLYPSVKKITAFFFSLFFFPVEWLSLSKMNSSMQLILLTCKPSNFWIFYAFGTLSNWKLNVPLLSPKTCFTEQLQQPAPWCGI